MEEEEEEEEGGEGGGGERKHGACALLSAITKTATIQEWQT